MALTLVGTPIGNLGDLTPRASDALRAADVIACEDTRRTRGLLTAAGIPAAGRLRAVHAHNEAASAPAIVEAVAAGRAVVYVTDAGMPAISDPGVELVRACLRAGLPVDVVPGPSALTIALVLSGLPTDRFAFEGFLPRKGATRKARLREIATDVRTTVLYESPRRVAATLAELASTCGPERPVAVARELTKLHGEVFRGSLGVAAELADAVDPSGEHVVVVGGAEASLATEAQVERAVRQALARGLSARDIATEVAAELGVARRRAYELALSLRGS